MVKGKKKSKTTDVSKLAVDVAKLTSAVQSMSTGAKPKKRKRTANKTNAVRDGVVELARTELLGTIQLDAGKLETTKVFKLQPSTFSFLKNISQSFDRSRWNAIQVYYKPAVAMTVSGIVTMGIDWDYKATTSTARNTVAALTPMVSGPVWQADMKGLLVPASRLQSREWYIHSSSVDIDAGPGQLVVSVAGDKTTTDKVMGEVWVSYHVRMMGTTA